MTAYFLAAENVWYIRGMAHKLSDSLKKIIGYFRQHLREDFNPWYYLIMGVFLTCAILFNYFFLDGLTVERWITRNFYGREICTLVYMAFYGFPYFFALGLHSFFHGETDFWKKRDFWIRILFGLFIISLDASFYYYRYAGELAETVAGRYIFRKWAANLISVAAIFVPLLLFKRFYDRQQPNFYGLTWKGFEWKPYAILLLLMVPLVVGAAFTEGFLSYYPTLKPPRAEAWEVLPAWMTMGLYELVYGLDFIWTEVAFRGFFVIGMAAVLGRAGIMPMTAIYCFRHFAKPMGETIGSIFGGYILGVIALHSKNIMGGVWIHMGVALLMEFMAIWLLFG